ncbi:hypothetical protein J2S70_000661 [Trueperella bonasi]|uniref:Uncharacterized protein n=1 Tax=Trueperella bonasi TaxID=312286 RepID=A0ABT9NFB0_9ACTO|nr:hypothetical protein [Trueperella bonasi]
MSILAEIHQVAKRVSCPGHVGLWHGVAFEKVTPPFLAATFTLRAGAALTHRAPAHEHPRSLISKSINIDVHQYLNRPSSQPGGGIQFIGRPESVLINKVAVRDVGDVPTFEKMQKRVPLGECAQIDLG